MTSTEPPLPENINIPNALPECPDWCDGDHSHPEAPGIEAEGIEHFTGIGGGILDEIRGSQDGRLLRRGGGMWDLSLVRLDRWDGRNGVPLMEFAFTDVNSDHRVVLRMTTGEARSLLAAVGQGCSQGEDLLL
jgi:hypothetical protein